MGLLGDVSRILNACRIYLAPHFNHKYYDLVIFNWYAHRHLREALSYDPEVAHVWDMCPSLIRSLKSYGCKVVLDLPVVPSSYTRRIAEQFDIAGLITHQSIIDIENQAFDEADLIIAPSGFAAKELELLGLNLDKVRVIEFGVSLPADPPDTGSKLVGKDHLDFCFAGNINERKGIDLLLSAWNSPVFTGDKLHLCGRIFPSASAMLKRNRSGAILTPGFINTFDYLPSCDVFVFPSWLEGSAKAVYEAMACGLPCIVTSSAGSVVRDGIDGFVFDPGDLDTLREKMLWFKENSDQIIPMGESARQRVSGFTWERYASRVIAAYGEFD